MKHSFLGTIMFNGVITLFLIVMEYLDMLLIQYGWCTVHSRGDRVPSINGSWLHISPYGKTKLHLHFTPLTKVTLEFKSKCEMQNSKAPKNFTKISIFLISG